MPFDVDALATSFRGVLRVAMGWPANSVRPANQNAPTGDASQPFATVLLTPVGATGQDARWYQDAADGTDNVVENREGTRSLVASVQLFRTGANAMAARLDALLKLEPNKEALRAAGLALVNVGVVKNISQVVETFWEERAQVDVTLYAVSLENATLPSLGSVPTSVTLND